MNDNIFKSCLSACRLLGSAFRENESIGEYAVPSPDFLAEFSTWHRLSSVVCSVLKDKNKYKKIFDRAGEEIFRQLKNDMLEEEISKRLSENGISHIFLKGNGFRRFYPEFLVRTSNDIDVFVPKKDFNRALELLKSMDFKVSSSDDVETGLEKAPSYFVELHSSMGGLTKKQRSFLARLAENAFSVCGNRVSLCDDDFYIYTVYHLYKHFAFAGAGVRMLFDVYAVGKCRNLDRAYIEKAFEELELSAFEKTVRALNGALFEGKEMTAEQREIAEFVFASGAYGTQENASSLKYVTNEITGGSCASALVLNYRLNFGSMKNRYPILKRFAFLFPFCCVHRFVKGFIFKRKVLKKALKTDIRVLKGDRTRLKHILKISGII